MQTRTAPVNWQFLPSRAKIIYQPLGVVGVVFVSSNKVNEFIHDSETVIKTRYPHPSSNEDYTHMISQAAWRRMQDLVDDAPKKGAHVVQPDSTNTTFTAENRVFPPTLIIGADDSMRVMREEIFGPILPVVTYSSFDDALEFINARPRPLALYHCDRNASRIKENARTNSVRGRHSQ